MVSKFFVLCCLYILCILCMFVLWLDFEVVGRIIEFIVWFFGIGCYLLVQMLFVLIWIVLNLFVVGLCWDLYFFILFNLVFFMQVLYVVLLILFVQNCQEKCDCVVFEEDCWWVVQIKVDIEYNVCELVVLWLVIGEVFMCDYLCYELDSLCVLLVELQLMDLDVVQLWVVDEVEQYVKKLG